MESNNGQSKAHAITENLRMEESIQAKKFMKQTEDHFRISCEAEKDFNMLRFVADKSFRYGFQRGMIAVFDAMDKHRQEMQNE